jgi:hypothetical protein
MWCRVRLFGFLTAGSGLGAPVFAAFAFLECHISHCVAPFFYLGEQLHPKRKAGSFKPLFRSCSPLIKLR